MKSRFPRSTEYAPASSVSCLFSRFVAVQRDGPCGVFAAASKGIHLIRTCPLSQRRDWLALVAVHSDTWLIAVAFYNGARLNKEGRCVPAPSATAPPTS